jgi:predicted SAM-dependent methyltransferase
MVAVNIGCNDLHIDGFVNIDLNPDVIPDLVADCTKLKDYFPIGSISFAYAGHFLEHLSVGDGKLVVSDVYDLLQNFGVFIATVPDYSKTKDLDIKSAERIILAEGEHKCLMNAERLKEYFTEAGFLTSVIADPKSVGFCPFPEVEWQTCIIAIKHPKPTFRGPIYV